MSERELPTPWQDAAEADVAAAVCVRAQQIEKDHATRFEAIRAAYCLYGDASQIARRRQVLRRRRNVIPEAIDALASELVQQPVRVMPVATAAMWDQRQKARWWGWYADASFTRLRVSYLAHQVARDALIAGIGAVVIVDTGGGPRPERVHPMDLLIDDAGCMDAEPLELIVRRRVSRFRLARDYPHLKKEILRAPVAKRALGRDALEVYEAWFDGTRHVVAVRGVKTALLDEKWEGRPPWAYTRLVPPTAGFVGESLVLRAAPLQVERNKLDARAQAEMHYNRARLFVLAGALNKLHLDNVPGHFVETKVPPQQAVHAVNMASVHQEVWARIVYLDDAIYRACQANELFAAGEKPAGIVSGKALITYREIRGRRHLPMIRELEDFHRILVEELIRGELRAHDADEAHKVVVRVSGVLMDLSVDKMRIDLESIQVQILPASALPLEPSGRIELLQGLVADQIITSEEFFALSAVPDFEKGRLRATAPAELIEAQLDRMLDDGEMRAPYKYMDLQLALRTGVRVLQRAELDGAPAERLALLREWLDQVGAELEALERRKAELAAAAAAPPIPPTPGGAPPPMPPPGGGGEPAMPLAA